MIKMHYMHIGNSQRIFEVCLPKQQKQPKRPTVELMKKL